jgi:hypothetical protein
MYNTSTFTVYNSLGDVWFTHISKPTSNSTAEGILTQVVNTGGFTFGINNTQLNNGWRSGGRRLQANTFQSVLITTFNNTFHSLITRFHYSNSDLFVYENNSLVGSKTDFQTDGVTDTTTKLFGIGASALNASNPFVGEYSEVILFTGTVDKDRIYNNQKNFYNL